MLRKLNEDPQINNIDNIVPTFYHSLFLTEYVLDSPCIIVCTFSNQCFTVKITFNLNKIKGGRTRNNTPGREAGIINQLVLMGQGGGGCGN